MSCLISKNVHYDRKCIFITLSIYKQDLHVSGNFDAKVHSYWYESLKFRNLTNENRRPDHLVRLRTLFGPFSCEIYGVTIESHIEIFVYYCFPRPDKSSSRTPFDPRTPWPTQLRFMRRDSNGNLWVLSLSLFQSRRGSDNMHSIKSNIPAGKITPVWLNPDFCARSFERDRRLHHFLGIKTNPV